MEEKVAIENLLKAELKEKEDLKEKMVEEKRKNELLQVKVKILQVCSQISNSLVCFSI